MVVRVGCDGTEVTMSNERFMAIVEVSFLDKEEVWAEVMDNVPKI